MDFETIEPDEIQLFRATMLNELRSAVGSFLTEFASFEALSLTGALQVLSHDMVVIELLQELMTLENRLTLLKRLAEERNVTGSLMDEVNTARKVAIKLLEHRNVVAHNATVLIAATITGGEKKTAHLGAGIRLPKSKRKITPIPPDDINALSELVESWHLTTPQIVEYIGQTHALQKMMHELTEKLTKHRQGRLEND